MTTRATKLETQEEFEIGTEDRVFVTATGQWYWQARGTSDCYGPFDSREDAEADYAR